MSKKGCTPKPEMRNLHHKMMMRNIYTAVAISLSGAFAFYMLHNRKRINTYKQFYAKYDPDEAFERMRASGYLSSAPAEDDDGEAAKR